MVWFPSIEYILVLFEDQIKQPAPLMNYEGLQTTLDKIRWGIPFHQPLSLWERVTILYKELVENHYFVDGNKRIAVLIAYLFLLKNGYKFTPPKGEIYETTMAVAQRKKEFNGIMDWFKHNSKRIKGEEK